ncbi:hypothetical protein BDN67DRAFT_963269 [Paxillus ammoniavirescens]|nr:hypothetical protein BDN67DRAFT_963269 [Paxillus ammoniavirescens]
MHDRAPLRDVPRLSSYVLVAQSRTRFVLAIPGHSCLLILALVSIVVTLDTPSRTPTSRLNRTVTSTLRGLAGIVRFLIPLLVCF